MGDMVSLQKQDQFALVPYLHSLVLPNAEAWFISKFGELRCAEEELAADDCLGPRIALTYTTVSRNLPASFGLTLQDLVNEGLINFEAVNYTETCPGPLRIVPSPKLVGGLTTTQFLSTKWSVLAQRQEPVYVVWAFREGKETTLDFFVYVDGAFRYIGMPHEAAVEDYQKAKVNRESLSDAASLPRYLTEDQLDMEHNVVDASAVKRTVVFLATVDSNGRVKTVSYIRGPEAYKEAAARSLQKRKFEPPGFGPHGFHPSTFCVSAVAQ